MVGKIAPSLIFFKRGYMNNLTMVVEVFFILIIFGCCKL